MDGIKGCDYCGVEYPDEAVVCAVEHNPMRGVLGESMSCVSSPIAERTAAEKVCPEYLLNNREIGGVSDWWMR